MKRKDELKIEILSNIKDEIIDKQSAKRYALMNKKRKPKWIIPSSVAAVLLIAIMIPLFIVLFSKQVPVYEGMTVSTTYQPSKNTASSGGVTMLSASGSGGSQISFLKDDNGNHNGHNKKPVEDIVDDEFSSSLTIPEQHMYYANPSQDIYITVHISNPDSFEILSFTLNGKKYSSYMFEDGSDMENLILKVTVPAGAEGITEYTIDAIKYVDGTAIKDVKMEGDRTVKVGVYTAGKQPTASVSDEIIGINDISFTVSINDRLDLIKMSEGNIFVIICDDSSVVYKQELNPDEINNIKFDSLIMDTTYRYAIVANYDSLDGAGFSTHILYEKEFTTKNIVAFKPASITQSGISFELEWEESFENKVLDSLALYRGEEKVRELDVNATSVDGLLSNNEYRLVATYTNKGETETSDLIFTTQAKATPEITITENSKTQTSLKFDISVTDIDRVGAITKLEIIHGEDVQNITDLSTRELTNLLSNNKYTVKVTYTYDLNDGFGNQTIEKTVDITTEAKTTPEITITENNKTQTSLGFDISVTDIDSVGTITKLELIQGEDVQNITDLSTRELTNLLSNNTYTVKVTYTYDLNDGVGNQTVEKAVDITTEEKAEPVFTFKNMVSETYSLGGEYDITNVDSTLISYKVELYKGDELVKENTDKEITFDSLDYYTDYTVKITYTFDVNDGKGVQTKTAEYAIKTLPYIDVTSATVLDKKDVYLDGDKATLRINIDNPLRADIISVTIGGTVYKVNASSTSQILLIDIEDIGKIGNGKIEGLTIKIDDTEYAITDFSETKLDVTVIGTLEITSWEIVDENFEHIEYASLSDKVYVLISANKLEGNTVTQITLTRGEIENNNYPIPALNLSYDQNEIKVLDSGRFYVELRATDAIGYCFNEISVTYTNEYIDSDTVTNKEFYQHPFIMLNSTDVRYISTPEEFMAMEDGYYYELTGDIDFSTVSSWPDRGLRGVLDGKGYALQNILLFVGEGSGDPMSRDGMCSGIFTYLDGILQNVKIESFVYTESTVQGGFDGTGVVGCVFNSGIIRNCSVDEASEIVTTRSNGGVGSICGLSYGLIENCINYSSIKTDGYAFFTGGICGRSDGIIRNCTNYGNVSSYGYNLSGISNNGYTKGLYAEGCNNYGEITALYHDDENYPFAITNGGNMVNCNNYGTVRHNSTMYHMKPNSVEEAEMRYVFVTSQNQETCHNYGAIYVGGTLIVEAKESPEE